MLPNALELAGVLCFVRGGRRAGGLDLVGRGAELVCGDVCCSRWRIGCSRWAHGQWQRIALARGLMRTEPLLLVLDEPTAALDPQAEHDLFAVFARQARAAARSTGAVTFLVSHRFSTVDMADRIFVIEQGAIAEAGTHRELLAAGGRYAELYAAQAAAYASADG